MGGREQRAAEPEGGEGDACLACASDVRSSPKATRIMTRTQTGIAESDRLLCFNLAASTALTLPNRHPRPPSGPSTPGSRSIPCQVLRSEGDVRCGASPSCCGIACADHEVATCGLRPLLLDRRGTLETHRHLVCVPVVTRGQRAEVLIRDVTEDAVPEATERGFCRSRCRKM